MLKELECFFTKWALVHCVLTPVKLWEKNCHNRPTINWSCPPHSVYLFETKSSTLCCYSWLRCSFRNNSKVWSVIQSWSQQVWVTASMYVHISLRYLALRWRGRWSGWSTGVEVYCAECLECSWCVLHVMSHLSYPKWSHAANLCVQVLNCLYLRGLDSPVLKREAPQLVKHPRQKSVSP